MKLFLLYEEESRFDGVDTSNQHQEPWNVVASKGKYGDSAFADTKYLLKRFKEFVIEHGIPKLSPFLKLSINRMIKDHDTRFEFMGFIMDMDKTSKLAGLEHDDILNLRKIISHANNMFNAIE